MELNKEQLEWIDAYMRVHNIETREEAIQSLINFYRAWTLNLWRGGDDMKPEEALNKLVDIFDKEGEEKALEFFVELLKGHIKLEK